MEKARILVIDDSQTIRKMVECHLSQAGYQVTLAAEADRGVELARSIVPDLILLDHQLPGTTGDDVCRRLLECETTARIPVVISSAMRNRAFVQYSEFPNVVDQIPKPFTTELLKSGVANALETGAIVVQAQRTGCAMPESVGEVKESALEGSTKQFGVREILDFLNNGGHDGILTLEIDNDRIRFAVAAGRIQAVFSPTIAADKLERFLPASMADLAPLLAVTIGEEQNAHMSGLIKLLERSLSDPRRLRTLLRYQAAVLTYRATTAAAGKFQFEAGGSIPPMFQAFPLQISLPALAVEGARRCEPAVDDAESLAPRVYARTTPRGGNLDRVGLTAPEMKIYTLIDGTQNLASIAQTVGLELGEIGAIVRGLELAGLAERRSVQSGASILVVEDDPETVRAVQRALGAEGAGYQLKLIRDRVGAQLLLRRNAFDLVLMAFDQPEQEAFYRAVKEQVPAKTRFVGVLGIQDESELVRLDAIGLDGVLHRPLSETDLIATVEHLLKESRTMVGAA